jgi:hypothetical protein
VAFTRNQYDAVTSLLVELASSTTDATQLDEMHSRIVTRELTRRDAAGEGTDRCASACRAALEAVPQCRVASEALLELALEDPSVVPWDEAVRTAETLHARYPESAIGAAVLGAALLRSVSRNRSGGGGGGGGGDSGGGGEAAATEGQSLLESAVELDKGCITALVELAELCARTRDDRKCVEITTAAEAEITTRCAAFRSFLLIY